jgi:hypothetical protein
MLYKSRENLLGGIPGLSLINCAPRQINKQVIGKRKSRISSRDKMEKEDLWPANLSLAADHVVDTMRKAGSLWSVDAGAAGSSPPFVRASARR